jgi:hypothetical protein
MTTETEFFGSDVKGNIQRNHTPNDGDQRGQIFNIVGCDVHEDNSSECEGSNSMTFSSTQTDIKEVTGASLGVRSLASNTTNAFRLDLKAAFTNFLNMGTTTSHKPGETITSEASLCNLVLSIRGNLRLRIKRFNTND